MIPSQPVIDALRDAGRAMLTLADALGVAWDDARAQRTCVDQGTGAKTPDAPEATRLRAKMAPVPPAAAKKIVVKRPEKPPYETPERIALLKLLWRQDDLTSQEIAERLSALPGRIILAKDVRAFAFAWGATPRSTSALLTTLNSDPGETGSAPPADVVEAARPEPPAAVSAPPPEVRYVRPPEPIAQPSAVDLAREATSSHPRISVDCPPRHRGAASNRGRDRRIKARARRRDMAFLARTEAGRDRVRVPPDRPARYRGAQSVPRTEGFGAGVSSPHPCSGRKILGRIVCRMM